MPTDLRMRVMLTPLVLLTGGPAFGRDCNEAYIPAGDLPISSIDAGPDAAAFDPDAPLACKEICGLGAVPVRCALEDSGTFVHRELLDNQCPE